MEKKKLTWNIGKMTFDEKKNQFTGFVNGNYCTMKQAASGEWFVATWVDAAMFEPRQQENQDQQG
jgi:hypothetical protein